MKTTNISSRIPNRFKSKDEETQNLEKGIMKALLEKYTPKVLYYKETLNEKEAQRRVA